MSKKRDKKVKVVKEDTVYRTDYLGLGDVIVPKGTIVDAADNLPETGRYWARRWEGMGEVAESWHRNYGFMLMEHEVEERADG